MKPPELNKYGLLVVFVALFVFLVLFPFWVLTHIPYLLGKLINLFNFVQIEVKGGE